MRLHTLHIYCCLLICTVSLVECGPIGKSRTNAALDIGTKGNSVYEKEHLQRFPLARAINDKHNGKRTNRLRWSEEDNDKSNERKLWISHPKPKTAYNGPDTQESEGPVISRYSIWAKQKGIRVQTRGHPRRKSLHKDTSVDIFAST